MNANQVIVALRPLEGHRFRLTADLPHSPSSYDDNCRAVRHLPPAERLPGAGNVILDTGEFCSQGASRGITFQASSIEKIEWECTVLSKKGQTVTITLLRKLDDPETEASSANDRA